MPKKKVLLGMSGGVDSSVSAVLLLQEGYEVIGAFMKNWSDGDDSAECSWRAERRDAMRVAAQLGIEFHTFDYEAEYREHVYEYMIREYKAGRTPNPDVLCNKYMKFGFLLREAEKLECEFIATGHYARIKRTPLSPPSERGEVKAHLLAGLDQNKDQSYFLARLEQDQIEKMLLPIGHLEKAEVRNIAREHNLPVAEKKDSQGICFVGKVKMVDFLKERIEEHEGDIVTTKGDVIGKHRGYEFYTNGQRSGLGIGGGTPYFVVDRKPETNEVIVAIGENDPALFRSKLIATELTETIPGALDKLEGKKLLARIRYRQPLQECTFTRVDPPPSQGGARGGLSLEVVFDEPQRAIAPGQFIAFYDGEELLGSAVIG